MKGREYFFFFFNFLLLFLSFSFFLSFFFPRFFYLVHVDYDCRDTYTPDGLIKKNRDTSFDKIAPVYRGHCTYYVFLSKLFIQIYFDAYPDSKIYYTTWVKKRSILHSIIIECIRIKNNIYFSFSSFQVE